MTSKRDEVNPTADPSTLIGNGSVVVTFPPGPPIVVPSVISFTIAVVGSWVGVVMRGEAVVVTSSGSCVLAVVMGTIHGSVVGRSSEVSPLPEPDPDTVVTCGGGGGFVYGASTIS